MTKRIRTKDVQIDLRGLMEAYERKLILEALIAHQGHQRRAAASLGILATTLHEKMKRLGIVVRHGSAAWIGPLAESTMAAGIERFDPAVASREGSAS